MTDTIADMIIRIKNGYMAHKKSVILPFSKMNQSIVTILKDEKYVESFEVKDVQPQKEIVVTLRYVGKSPAITDVKRISSPGRRTYSSVDRLPKALGGYGVVIVTTNKGVMTDKQARKLKVGGEVLCSIW